MRSADLRRSRRRYQLGKRAEAAATTRRRIVEATLTLHDEQGISSTSVRDIATRAAVAPSTVLQHFPQMSELIRACGELSSQLAPMPGELLIAGVDRPAERVQRMAAAMFEWWELLGPGIDHLRTDRRRIPEVEAWFADVEARHRTLAAAALRARGDAERVHLLVALTTPDGWAALRAAGLDVTRAAVRVARLICPQADSKEAVH
jgi:AcrR family transcriptional regulator